MTRTVGIIIFKGYHSSALKLRPNRWSNERTSTIGLRRRGLLVETVGHRMLALSRYFSAAITLVAIRLFAQTSPSFSETTPFVSGQNGYNTYRIPAIVRSTNGTIGSIIPRAITGIPPDFRSPMGILSPNGGVIRGPCLP